MRKEFGFFLGALVAGTVLSQPVLADELIPGGEEKFEFVLGGIVARFDSSLGLDGTINDGSIIDLNGPGGSKDVTNVVLGATWRPGSRHRISGVFFTTKKDRSLSFDQSVTIGDDTLVPPTTLTATSRNRFLFGTYQYSFVKNKDVELAGLLGLYLNKFSADLSGTATVSNGEGETTITRTVEYRPSVTVPMPLIGASINWYASPRINVGGSLSGMKAKIGNVNGSVYVATVSAEYMFTRNLGAGLSFMHTDADVDITQKTFRGSIDWTNDNFLLFATLKF